MLNLLGTSNPLGSDRRELRRLGQRRGLVEQLLRRLGQHDPGAVGPVPWSGATTTTPIRTMSSGATPTRPIRATSCGATACRAAATEVRMVSERSRSHVGRASAGGPAVRRRGRRLRHRGVRLQRRRAVCAATVPHEWVLFAFLTIVSGMLTLKIPSIESRFSVSRGLRASRRVLLFGPRGRRGHAGARRPAHLRRAGKMNRLQTMFNFANLGLSMWAVGQLFFFVSGTGTALPCGRPRRRPSCSRWR